MLAGGAIVATCGPRHLSREWTLRDHLSPGERCASLVHGRTSLPLTALFDTGRFLRARRTTSNTALRREIKEYAGIDVGEVRYVARQALAIPALALIAAGNALNDTLTSRHRRNPDSLCSLREESASMLEATISDCLAVPPSLSMAPTLIQGCCGPRAWLLPFRLCLGGNAYFDPPVHAQTCRD